MSTSTNFMESKVSLNFEDPSIYHDHVLIVGEKKFYVVSEILSMWSEHFRGLFHGKFDEDDKKEIELNELDANIFEMFLKLIYYNNYIVLKADDVIPLIELSYRFLAPMVLEQCLRYIESNLDKLDGIKIQLFEVARAYGIEGLKSTLIVHFNNADVLSNVLGSNDVACYDILDIANQYNLEDLKKNTALHMVKQFSYENCSEYLDCCEKYDMSEFKTNLLTAIRNWEHNKIPSKIVIELAKSAFKHDVEVLKEKLRYCIFRLNRPHYSCSMRGRDDKIEVFLKSVNWFLKDYQEEIFMLPSDIMQFIIVSTNEHNM